MVFKNRYFVMEIFFQSQQDAEAAQLNQNTVNSAIKDSLLLNFGEHGLGLCLSSLQVKYMNPITKLCIIRCSRMEYEKVWCAISFITNIGNLPVFFNLLDLSGNIRSCKRMALEYDRNKLRQLQLVDRVTNKQVELAYTSFEKIHHLDG